MVSFRPHILVYAEKVVSEDYTDDNGDYHIGETTVTEHKFECRLLKNTSGKKVTFEGGSAYVYRYEIILDRDCGKFERGDNIKVFHDNELLVESVVADFFQYQLYSKIWV